VREASFPDITRYANVHGRMIVVATHEDPITFDGNMMMGKEHTILGSVGYPTEFPQVMAKLAEGARAP
jgi:threonine dehydrogenase-like Zn-dependent dehydrogenase